MLKVTEVELIEQIVQSQFVGLCGSLRVETSDALLSDIWNHRDRTLELILRETHCIWFPFVLMYQPYEV